MVYIAFIFLSVCLSFCPSVSNSRDNYWSEVHEFLLFFWTRKHWLDFGCGTRRCLEDSLTLQHRTFFTRRLIYLKKTDRMFMRISLDVSSDKKVPIKVWKSSGSERRISGPWIQTGSALEEVSTPNARVYYDTFINTNNNSRPTSVVTVLMLYYPLRVIINTSRPAVNGDTTLFQKLYFIYCTCVLPALGTQTNYCYCIIRYSLFHFFLFCFPVEICVRDSSLEISAIDLKRKTVSIRGPTFFRILT